MDKTTDITRDKLVRDKMVRVPESDFYTVVGRDNEEFEIYGKLLGEHSSRSLAHSGHPEFDETTGKPSYVTPGQRCSRCRWFEVSIYRVEQLFGAECTCGAGDEVAEDEHTAECGERPVPQKFLVVTYGPTIIPGEVVKRSLKWTDYPFVLFEFLVQTGARGRFLPSTSATALAMAASRDADLFIPYTMFISKTFNGSF